MCDPFKVEMVIRGYLTGHGENIEMVRECYVEFHCQRVWWKIKSLKVR